MPTLTSRTTRAPVQRRCTARCHNAKSPPSTCRCICRGRNHGKARKAPELAKDLDPSPSAKPQRWPPAGVEPTEKRLMPKWLDQPPTDLGPYAFRIVRTPADKPITGVITCTDLVGCNTHYVKNRTIPCEGPGACDACAQGHSWRWHGYVSALLSPGLEHVLFECTATASETFRNYMEVYDNLRGCWFRAWRPSKRHNGRVVIECRPTDPAKTRLPDPPDIKAILCHIWNVQNTNANYGPSERTPSRHVHVHADKGDGRYRP